MSKVHLNCKHNFSSDQTYLITTTLLEEGWNEDSSKFLQQIEVEDFGKLNFIAKALPGIDLAVGVWFLDEEKEEIVCTLIIPEGADKQVIEEAFENITEVEAIPEEPEIMIPDAIFLKITLNDESVVYALNEDDVKACCISGGATTNLTINGTTFVKNQVVSVEFGEDWNLTTVFDDFFSSCSNLVSLSEIPSMITNMGMSFLSYCTSFNQPINIPEGVKGNYCLNGFLKGCTSFNQPITIPNGVTGEGCLGEFLSHCTSFNQSITISNSVTGEYCLYRFLFYCTSFNQPITIPNGVTGEGCLDSFLSHCTSFNQSIVIPSGVAGNYCLYNFLWGCTSFNQPITIPNGVTGTYCLRDFLRGCTSFNRSINIPDDLNGGNCLQGFLRDCISFNQSLTIYGRPGGFPFVDFLYNCNNFTNTLTVYPGIETISISSFSNNTLATDSNTAPMYVQGVKIAGLDQTQFNTLLTKVPDRTTSPFRKLVRV